MTSFRLTIVVASFGYLLTVLPLLRATSGRINWFVIAVLLWYTLPGFACVSIARLVTTSRANFQRTADFLAVAGALIAVLAGVRFSWAISESKDAQAAIGFLFVPILQLFWSWPLLLAASLMVIWPRRKTP